MKPSLCILLRETMSDQIGTQSHPHLKLPRVALFVIAARVICARNISRGTKPLMTHSHTSATSAAVIGMVWYVSNCSFCNDRSIVCNYSKRRSRTQKSVLPAESHGTPQSHNSSSKATIPQPLPQTRLAAIGKATGTSSMANARAKSYRNALPPSISSVETDIEPSLPAGPEYLEAILHELSASPPRSTPLQHNEFSGSQSQCLKDDFESYVNRFHHRWHIITAPAYDFSEKPFDNAASVIMIGSYLSGKHGHNHLHINIHDKLVDQYIHLLVETRLSLDCQQRPRLSDVELEAVLPSSFSLRNCYGMDVFLYRQQYESASRDIKLSSMIKHPEHFLPDPLLVEDIQLGLCGLIIEVFEHGNTRPFMNTPLNAATDSIIDSILKRLAIWNTHIEYVTQKLSSDGLDATHDSLLINYFAWEDETQGLLNGRTEVRRRVQEILADTTIVRHRLQSLLSVL
ncbi:hypothetical protein IWW34DRAFT_824058 [Fusarium oxysporum f. sp. albedinis]|nr:hypothetical protein IWW34DRAFT_824058 [Fusarium oxysporum f. sp. albedinis]